MTNEELLLLVRAGFTKSDIATLYGNPAPASAPASASPVSAPASAPTSAPASASNDAPVTMTDAQFQQLLQSLTVAGTGKSIDIPKSSEDILLNHAKDIFGIKEGDNK